MRARELKYVIPAVATSDGAGVKIRRSIGAQPGLRLDPFLMLDEFFSDDPEDYLAGFPAHPHRGFETVTYMLDGHMQHKDHLGNTGDLGPGDVQWMTAARGIIHSEMPQQTEGRMRGFQLWLNLPASEKMAAADYRDIPAADIPQVSVDGSVVRVIAGDFGTGARRTPGAVTGRSTAPLYLDIALEPDGTIEVPVAATHSAFVYLYDGTGKLGDHGADLPLRGAAALGQGDVVRLAAGTDGARLLLLAARPLEEPVVQYGPFVMNTRDEIEQALADYRDGKLTAA